MDVKMHGTHLGSPDGHTVNTYEDGRVYAVPDELAQQFVAAGMASEYAPKAKPETKPKAKPKKR